MVKMGDEPLWQVHLGGEKDVELSVFLREINNLAVPRTYGKSMDLRARDGVGDGKDTKDGKDRIHPGRNLLVSVDGPRNIHDRYRRYAHGGVTFESISQNLENLQRKYPDYYQHKVSFNLVMAPPYHYGAVREFVRSSPLLRVHYFTLSFLSRRNSTFFDRFTIEDLNRREFEDGETEYVDALSSGFIKDPHIDLDKLPLQLSLRELEILCWRLVPTSPLASTYHPGGICIPGERKIFVSTDGKFFPCERVNSTEELYCLGSVDSGLDTAKVLSLITKHTKVHDACKTCYAIRNCTVCFVENTVNGVFNKSEKCLSCDSVRTQFHADLIKLAQMFERNIPMRIYAKQVGLQE